MVLEKSKKALNLAMGRSIDFPFELNPDSKVPDLSLTEDKAIESALKQRSDLKQLSLRKSMDEITTTIYSRANWPTISGNVTYTITDNAVVNANAVDLQNLQYGVNMNWPVFDGLLTYAKVQKSQNSIIQDQISIDQLQQSIVLDVRNKPLWIFKLLENQLF